jgi:transcriptional activator
VDTAARWADITLDAGDADTVIAELTPLIDEYPLAEHLIAVQMRALHALGRHAQALECHAATRRRLADELGVDPGPQLRPVHEAILRDNAATPPMTYASTPNTTVRDVDEGETHQGTGIPLPTRYLHQVRRIAPTELLDRHQDLTDLARFCTDPATAGQYWWWRAQAWSGKSAFLSWFVRHPPAGVRIVSFFITARLAS